MGTVVLISIILFLVSATIVTLILINMYKRQYKGNQEVPSLQADPKNMPKEEETKQQRVEDKQREIEKNPEVDDQAQKEPNDEQNNLTKELEIAEEKHRAEERRLKEQAVIKKIPPVERGGRPRSPTIEPVIIQLPKPSSLKPEIICWNEDWRWIVGIEVTEEFESPRVTQDDESLERNTSDGLRYHLKHLESTVKVAWPEGEKEIPVIEEGRGFLIFKMRRNWKGTGRLVRRPTTGYYLAIVPQEWNRDEERSGRGTVEPENIQIDGYKAHFFYPGQNEDPAIAFINANGEQIQLESGCPRFQLIGKEISDSSDDMGPLFGEEPPRIKTIEREWGNVGVIVVGEERSGRNRWRTQFVPQEGAIEQRMLDELTNRRGGWYYVRIYDNKDDLLESMDFRFSAGLKNIQIMNSECLPEPVGYNDVTVQFIHQANCKVEPADGEMHHALTIRRENGLSIVTVPPNPDYDKTNWILMDGDAEVKVTVLVERIWWCVGSNGVVPTNWMDKHISLSRKDFNATTDKVLWIKLPRPRWLNKIDVGFDRIKSRSYNVGVEKKEIAIPFRDFCDAEEIQKQEQECFFQLFIDARDKIYSTPLLQICTFFHCKNCKFITTLKQEAFSHIDDHLSELIPQLSYKELYRRSDGSLPLKIYQCLYCNSYVQQDDCHGSLTSAITSHQEQSCQKVEREFGLPKISFSVVTDPDEIRENVRPDLPQIYQCKKCDKELQGDDRELRLKHLQENHKDELFEIS